MCKHFGFYCISLGTSGNMSETKCTWEMGDGRWESNTNVDRTQWRDLEIVVMNLEVPYEAGNFLSFGSQDDFSPHN
jgi:hypothetical protein